MALENLKFGVLLFVICICSCSAPPSYPYFRTGEVRCVKNDARLVTVESKYTAATSAQAQMYAERNAVENLLFKGIAGCYEKPVVENEQKSLQDHAAFYEWLITQREYERFITNRSDNAVTSKNQVALTETITFDVPALRKEMESRGVIRKLGF